MTRSTWTGVLVAALALLLGIWWFSTGPDAPYPHTERIDGLADSTTIQWSEEGVAHINTSDSTDFFATLGYAHGVNRGWTLSLWRQTALGNLSRWFGAGVAPLDRHARSLGLARHARQSYERLPPSTKRRLQHYARGMNAALRSGSVRDDAPFVLLDITPASWAPWHGILIERLLAWLATRPLDPPSHAPPSVTEFAEKDRQYRRWLHLHGWNRSVAWATRSGDGPPTLFQRHVLGATAMPVVQEVSWTLSTDTLTAATLPGTLLFPTGRTPEYAWASLLQSTASLSQTVLDSTRLQTWHERIEPADGDEQLVHVRRHEGDLLLSSSSPSVVDSLAQTDSAQAKPQATGWTLQWPGFHTGSDLPAWLQRAGLRDAPPDSARFRLFSASGLYVSANDWTVLGSPPIIARDSLEQTILIGASPWAQQQAKGLQSLARPPVPTEISDWSASDSSVWAADLMSHLQPVLRTDSQTSGRRQNARTYLRNWNHSYTPASIGATVFDQWMRAYRAELGHVPTLTDTAAFFATYRQRRALHRALDRLTTRLGPDVRRWRWERAVTDRRYFPVWSADSLVEASLEEMRTTRYAPLSRTGQGHPSALAGGPSLVDPPAIAPSPTAWAGWTRPNGSFTVRRHHYAPSAVFARSRIQTDRPPPVRFSLNRAVYSTTLLPPE